MPPDQLPEGPATPAPEPAKGRFAGIPYRWVAMGVCVFGTFMVVLDTTVVNLALPSLQREFDTIEGIEWVVTAYLAAVGVTQMCSGWIADRFGRKQAFIGALAIFTVASVLCAVSVTLPMLVVTRILQGIGGGLLAPVAMAMIYELFEPEERGRAIGYYGIAVMAAPALGPVLGGGLVTSVGWRWLFLINVPVGLVGIPLAIRLLEDTGFRERRRFDRTGLGLGGVGVAAVLIGLALGTQWSWVDPSVLVTLAVGAMLVVAFVRHGLRTDNPLVELRLFAQPVFTVGMIAVALMTVAQFTRLIYIPLELATVRGISEFEIGLLMLPSAIGMAVTLPMGGRLADRIGAKLPVAIGAAIMFPAYVAMSQLTIDTPLPLISAILFVGGVGGGLAVMPPNILAMNAVRASQISQATALSNVNRQLTAAIGTAVLASIFAATRTDAPAGTLSPGEALAPYETIFLVGAGFLAVVVFVAIRFLPGRETALALQAERRAEQDGRLDAASPLVEVA